ncbi:uncharacterized protein LOC143426836 [Xylocopa sonorina]|uniref:uncharacterized protein LOC143426836 n=1 Tax=Xylocopa sonorina TaxID=1818115 RepID=UPI00403ADA81
MPPNDYYYPNRGNGIWSSPDGCDPLNKIISALKAGFIVSVPITLLVQRKFGAKFESPSTFGRLIQVSVPVCGASLLFTCASFIAARVRDKNDTLNSVIGAAALIPLVRHFYSFSYTIPVMGAIFATVITMRELNGIGTPTLDQRLPYYGRDRTNLDWYLWSQNKPPEEPYIKYKNSGFFFWKF